MKEVFFLFFKIPGYLAILYIFFPWFDLDLNLDAMLASHNKIIAILLVFVGGFGGFNNIFLFIQISNNSLCILLN